MRSGHWYRPIAVRRRTAVPAAALALVVALAGCGQARQDAHAQSGTFPVQIVRASFPARQSLARTEPLVLAVRNAGSATIPNLAITVDGLYAPIYQPGLASRQRPVWIVDQGPGPRSKQPVQGVGEFQGGDYVTYLTNTWAAGPLAPGHTATFVWSLTPVRAGAHVVHFTVSAGLYGNAKAVLSTGAAPRGAFLVAVVPKPPATHVDPATGQVVPGPAPNGS
jgi:hypothetical protein